jgi:peptide/nickel transport system permease protein
MTTQAPLITSLDPVPPPPAAVARPRRSPGRRLGRLGAVLLALLVGAAVFAPLLAPYAPDAAAGDPFERPSAAHLLGTNDIGEDLFSQLLFGARVSLSIAILSALIAVTIGMAVALVAAYRGGRVEAFLMRVVDLTLSFPFLVLVIVLAAFFGRGLLTTVVVIGAVIWARPARVLRSQLLKTREFQHVTAAVAMGATGFRVITRHLLPRVAPLAAAQFVRAANVSVMLEASLSFLGLGDPTRVSWGTTLHFANARNAILTEAWPWWILPPGLALTAAVIAFAFLGYAVEEWADPRLTGTARRHRRRPGPRPSMPAATADYAGPLLDVRELTVEYRTQRGPLRAVDAVSLQIPAGTTVGLVGESGSGKSTLVTALLGLTRPPGRIVEGEMAWKGHELGRARRSLLEAMRGREIALVPQSAMNALNPAYDVHRQVAEAAALTREATAAASRAHELLDLVGLPADRHRAYPHEFSGGMRQRVVIAMALANDPSLLVADEPVTGLDVVTQARILQLLLAVRDRFGMSVLLISHDLPLVAHAADQLLVMHHGSIVEAGSTATVTGAPQHPYTRHLLRSFPSVHGPRVDLAVSAERP